MNERTAFRGRPRRKGDLYPLACQECGDNFTSTRSDAETCSPKCRKARQRREESLSRIILTNHTGGAKTVSGDVTDADTRGNGATTQSRQLDDLEYNELSWGLTVASSNCHYPNCQTARKGMVLRQRRHSGPMLCPHHWGRDG